jgi:hypothetical protein
MQPATDMEISTFWMRPPALGLREMAADVDDLLDMEERAGVQAVCFLTENLDKHLKETERSSALYFATHKHTAPLSNAALADIQEYRQQVQEARNAANKLVEICARYRRRPRPWFLNRPLERAREWLNRITKGDSDLP